MSASRRPELTTPRSEGRVHRRAPPCPFVHAFVCLLELRADRLDERVERLLEKPLALPSRGPLHLSCCGGRILAAPSEAAAVVAFVVTRWSRTASSGASSACRDDALQVFGAYPCQRPGLCGSAARRDRTSPHASKRWSRWTLRISVQTRRRNMLDGCVGFNQHRRRRSPRRRVHSEREDQSPRVKGRPLDRLSPAAASRRPCPRRPPCCPSHRRTRRSRARQR